MTRSEAVDTTQVASEPSLESADDATLAEQPRSRIPSVSGSLEKQVLSSPPVKQMSLPSVSHGSKEQFPGFKDLAKQRSRLSTRDATEGRSKKEIMSELKREASRGISPYPGKGTEEEPYIVDWLPGEKANPYNWNQNFKWVYTITCALVTLCIAFASSCYSGAAPFLVKEFEVSEEVIILGISLYVLGFGFGPLIWAPASEMAGRRLPFLISYLPFALFHLGGALAHNIETLIITRFFAGFFGSSMLTNAGGCIADVFSAKERGLATALFSLAPFLGPVIGPIVGGFAGESYLGWRSVFWIMFIFSIAMYIAGIFLLPESYAPILVRRRAAELQAASSSEGGPTEYYIGKYDHKKKTNIEIIKINLVRPFKLLFLEPIVLLLSIYVAIIYGTLYLFFTAYPLVFQSPKPLGYGWSPGVGGLAFIGVGIGMVAGLCMTPISNRIYNKAAKDSGIGRAPPEARLPMACLGACLLPIGLFWFAWTSQPSVMWLAPVAAGAPFGMGMLLVFNAVISYLIDSYLLFAASALAANAVLRSLLGAIFPLFSTYMYHNLGHQWASTLVAFLSLICVPMPFGFYYYGAQIRARSKFAPNLPIISPTAAPAAGATATANTTETTETIAELNRISSIHSRSHLQHVAVIKTPQPDVEDALEPEFAYSAGEGEQRMRDAPKELLGIAEEDTTGHNAV